MKLISIGNTTFNERRQAARFLHGLGIEVGPLHVPIEVDKRCCRVKYVDRLTAEEVKIRFPELKDEDIIFPDIIFDVALDGLAPIADESLDFVIASHLHEHVPNPLGLIKECYRVLRNNGVLYLAVPDKDYTFDRDRQITPLSHLIKDMENNTTAVDEEHLVDWVTNANKKTVPADPVEKRRMFDGELNRSIHVHVWKWGDVAEFLRYMIMKEKIIWELCEAYLPKGVKDEAIFVLRKVNIPVDEAVLHFDSVMETIVARETAMESVINMYKGQGNPVEALSEIREEIKDIRLKVRDLHSIYTFPLRRLRKMLKKLSPTRNYR
jgi:SAM-dependent methyltransferase